MIYEREGMYEREIKYKTKSLNIPENVNTHTPDVKSHNFGIMHGYAAPKMKEIREDQLEEDTKNEESFEYRKENIKDSEIRLNRATLGNAHKFKTHTVETGMPKIKAERSKVRSKSPEQEPIEKQAKIVTIDTESEKPVYNPIIHESEVNVKRLSFDSSSDDSNYKSDHEFDEAEGDENLVNEEDIRFTRDE